MLQTGVGCEKWLKTDFPDPNPVTGQVKISSRGRQYQTESGRFSNPRSFHRTRLFPDCHHSDKDL
jgi:hypothetical protein